MVTRIRVYVLAMRPRHETVTQDEFKNFRTRRLKQLDKYMIWGNNGLCYRNRICYFYTVLCTESMTCDDLSCISYSGF